MDFKSVKISKLSKAKFEASELIDEMNTCFIDDQVFDEDSTFRITDSDLENYFLEPSLNYRGCSPPTYKSQFTSENQNYLFETSLGFEESSEINSENIKIFNADNSQYSNESIQTSSNIGDSKSYNSNTDNKFSNQHLQNINDQTVSISCKNFCTYLMKPIANKIVKKLKEKKNCLANYTVTSKPATNKLFRIQSCNNQFNAQNCKVYPNSNLNQISTNRPHPRHLIYPTVSNTPIRTLGTNSAENKFTKCGEIIYYNV